MLSFVCSVLFSVEHKFFSETFKVGVEGRCLSFCGCTVDIPAGALSTETNISLSIVQVALPDGIRVTSILHCEPDGLLFNREVTIVLPLNGRPFNIKSQADVPKLQLMVRGSIKERWHSAKSQKLKFPGMSHSCKHFSIFFWSWKPTRLFSGMWYRCVFCSLFEKIDKSQTTTLRVVVCERNLQTVSMDTTNTSLVEFRDS